MKHYPDYLITNSINGDCIKVSELELIPFARGIIFCRTGYETNWCTFPFDRDNIPKIISYLRLLDYTVGVIEG